MVRRRQIFFEWAPLVAALLTAVGVALHTRGLDRLGPRDLTLILAAAMWLLTAATISAGEGRKRLARRLSAAGPAAVALGVAAMLSAAWAGKLNYNFPIVILLGAHCWLAAANARLFPLVAGFLGVLTWALLYGSLALLATAPAFSRIEALRPLALRAYEADFRIIQFEPACAQYDPEFFYRLRPGVCVFYNTEFRTEYRINSLGVRDDEASLAAPEVILLGDSYAMGWGVEQDETFGALLEVQLGRKVLNAGISSFGTVRELMLLDKIDRSAADTVILQYCDNDKYENRTFLENGSNLPIASEREYDETVAYQQSTLRFHPLRLPYKVYESLVAGRLLEQLHRWGWPLSHSMEGLQIDEAQSAREFMAVLERSPVDLSGLRMAVFDVGWGVGRESHFLAELRRLQGELPSQDWRSRIETVDVLPALGYDEMLLIDRHLNARGHRRVAELLAPALRRDGG